MFDSSVLPRIKNNNGMSHFICIYPVIGSGLVGGLGGGARPGDRQITSVSINGYILQIYLHDTRIMRSEPRRQRWPLRVLITRPNFPTTGVPVVLYLSRCIFSLLRWLPASKFGSCCNWETPRSPRRPGIGHFLICHHEPSGTPCATAASGMLRSRCQRIDNGSFVYSFIRLSERI